jgi:hypothetical protein
MYEEIDIDKPVELVKVNMHPPIQREEKRWIRRIAMLTRVFVRVHVGFCDN